MSTYKERLLSSHHRATRKKAFRRFIIFTVAIAVIFFVAIGLLLSKYFWVKDVVIEGYARTSPDELRAHIENWLSEETLFFPWHRSLWLLPAGSLKADLAGAFPTIKEISIMRTFPNILRVRVQEYDAWGVLCQNEPEECFWIDRAGIAFQPAPAFSGLIVPKIIDQRQRRIVLGAVELNQQLMKLTAYFNERASSNEQLQSLQFTIGEQDRTIHAITRAGWEILLLEDTDPEVAYKNLALSLEREIKDKIPSLDYIDLRFGNKIFYKFKK